LSKVGRNNLETDARRKPEKCRYFLLKINTSIFYFTLPNIASL